MKQDYHQLLKPEIINSVSGLSLIAKVITDGYLSGYNASKRVGYGMEFSQYTHYEPGDDLRLLDWKMLARSGKYYIRQSEIETNVAVKFIVDSSASMLHEEQGLQKIDFVKVMVAALAHLAGKQGDEIGLYTLNEKQIDSLSPKGGKQQFNQFLYKLIQIKNEGRLPKTAETLQQIHSRSQKELLLFITDMYEHEAELIETIKGLKTSRNEVVVIRVMGKAEMDFAYKGSVTFQDLETGVRLKVDATQVKKQYLESLEENMNTIKTALLANNISFHLFTLDQPISELLQAFLKRRSIM